MVAPGPRRDPTRIHSRAHRGQARSLATGPIVLPLAGCDLPVPDMPTGRAWTEAERGMWDELWASPQATQWHDSYVPIVALYVRVVCDSLNGRVTAGLTQEARHLADHLGLSPAGLKTLGWTIESGDANTGEIHVLPGGAA